MQDEDAGPVGQPRQTVLVVDDSGVIRRITGGMLKDMGFDVGEAENGAEALKFCAAQLPDAILLDWNMPVMDGITFLGRLREDFSAPLPKVIFCTTENEGSFIMRAMEGGADEFIMKPFDRDILLGKLEQVGLR